MYCTVLARDPFVIDVSITLDECACSKGLTLDETLEYGRNLVFPQHVTRATVPPTSMRSGYTVPVVSYKVCTSIIR